MWVTSEAPSTWYGVLAECPERESDNPVVRMHHLSLPPRETVPVGRSIPVLQGVQSLETSRAEIMGLIFNEKLVV